MFNEKCPPRSPIRQVTVSRMAKKWSTNSFLKDNKTFAALAGSHPKFLTD